MAKETKDAYYFQHDANTRNDPKIIKLRRILGREGSDVFFDVLCFLREQAEYRLPMDTIPDLAYNLRYPEVKLRKVLTDFELFSNDGQYFHSPRLSRDMKKWEAKKLSYSERGKKGREAQLEQKPGLAQQQPEQKPGNKINKLNKGNKIEENDFVDNTPPPINGFRNLESLKVKVLADQNFVAQIHRLGVTDQLPGWLEAFGRFLQFSGATLKQERDYRQHFPRWLAKIPNYRSADPQAYNPAGTIQQATTGRRVIMLHNMSGNEVDWTETEYQQYCAEFGSGYKFLRYE